VASAWKKEGASINLTACSWSTRKKLRQLDAQTAHAFLQEGVLGWIYAHLLSLPNIDRLTRLLEAREQVEAAATRN